MTSLFAAVTIGLIQDNSDSNQSKIVIDPTAKMIRKAAKSSVIVFVFESRNRNVVASHIQSGCCSEAKFQECLGLARKASTAIFDFYREVVKKKFSKEFEAHSIK